MERDTMWLRWTGLGLEHLHLFQQKQEIIADGLVLGVREHKPFRALYEIHCTQRWELRAVHVSLLGESRPSVHLFTDGSGKWETQTGEALPLLQGCLDVDISVTPFTNTLPIRRLALQPGATATLNMVYIQVPEMLVEVTQQRYTCLARFPGGGQYRFESLTDGAISFAADLPVDQDGLVLDYPGLFRRADL